MKSVIMILGALIILIGASFLIAPEVVLSWLENEENGTTVYLLAIIMRLAMGTLFIIAAKESRYPGIIKVFGYLLVAAAIVFVAIGQQSFQNFISSMIPTFKAHTPISGLLAIAFGGLLIHAFSGKKVTGQLY